MQQSSEQRKVSLALCTSKIVADSLGLRKAAKTATMSHGDMGNIYMWVSICCFCKLKALILSSLPFFPKQWLCEKDIFYRFATSPLVMTSIFDEISIHTGSLDASLISLGKKMKLWLISLTQIPNLVNLVHFCGSFHLFWRRLASIRRLFSGKGGRVGIIKNERSLQSYLAELVLCVISGVVCSWLICVLSFCNYALTSMIILLFF